MSSSRWQAIASASYGRRDLTGCPGPDVETGGAVDALEAGHVPVVEPHQPGLLTGARGDHAEVAHPRRTGPPRGSGRPSRRRARSPPPSKAPRSARRPAGSRCPGRGPGGPASPRRRPTVPPRRRPGRARQRPGWGRGGARSPRAGVRTWVVLRPLDHAATTSASSASTCPVSTSRVDTANPSSSRSVTRQTASRSTSRSQSATGSSRPAGTGNGRSRWPSAPARAASYSPPRPARAGRAPRSTRSTTWSSAAPPHTWPVRPPPGVSARASDGSAGGPSRDTQPGPHPPAYRPGRRPRR